jgi:hypothetical protein
LKFLIRSLVGTVAITISLSLLAQFRADQMIPPVHTKAGEAIIAAHCKAGLQLIHVLYYEERNNTKYPITSSTQCVPKSGLLVLGILCSFKTNTCTTMWLDQSAKELEEGLREMARKGQQI